MFKSSLSSLPEGLFPLGVVGLSARRWLDLLRHRLPVPDGSTGGDAEPAGAERHSALVHYEAAEWLPRAPQQTCRHMLLLLGGSHA